MTIQIPEDWDELTEWMIDDVFDARDALVNLQRQAKEATVLIRKMLAEMQWMTGSNDFAEGGVAHRGFENGVRPVMAEAEAFLDPD
jgi:hypothetical protein